MRISRGLAVLAGTAIAAATLFTAGNAGAVSPAPYPPVTSASLSVSTTTPYAGDVITVTGSNYGPNESVELDLHSAAADLGSATTDPAGSFTTTVTIPADAAGAHTITGTGATSGREASADLTVLTRALAATSSSTSNTTVSALGDTSSGGLPNTGFAVISTTIVGIVAMLLGIVLIASGRRRRGSSR